MADFSPGDLVVLKSGSMRMLVERVEDDQVHVLWANEGLIGRDAVPAFALNKWEHREAPDRPRPPPRRRDDEGGDDRPRQKRSFGDRDDRGPRGGDRDDRPPRKPAAPRGMDGKPRQKTHFRKDD